MGDCVGGSLWGRMQMGRGRATGLFSKNWVENWMVQHARKKKGRKGWCVRIFDNFNFEGAARASDFEDRIPWLGSLKHYCIVRARLVWVHVQKSLLASMGAIFTCTHTSQSIGNCL